MEWLRSTESCVYTMLRFLVPSLQTQVLGEIGQPRKKFPRASAIGVSIVIILYILVNVSYVSAVHYYIVYITLNTTR